MLGTAGVVAALGCSGLVARALMSVRPPAVGAARAASGYPRAVQAVVLAGLVMGLCCPYLALLRPAPWWHRRRTAALIGATLAYAGAGLLALLALRSEAEPAGALVQVGAAVILGVLTTAALLGTARDRRVIALAAGVAVSLVMAVLFWASPPRIREGLLLLGDWLDAPAHGTTAALVVGACGVLFAAWLVAAVGARRLARSLILCAGLLPGAVWWAAAPGRAPRAGLDRLVPGDYAPTAPVAPLAAAESEAALGWYWVRTGHVWHEAFLVQPPCRVSASIVRPDDGRLRLLLASPAQHVADECGPLQVHCRVSDGSGAVVAEASARLQPVDSASRSGAWTPVDLAVADEARGSLTLDVEASRAGGGAAVPVLAVAPGPRADAAAARDGGAPNCLIILADALRPDRLHCYGYLHETSPALDRLAGEGTLFEDVVSSSSWTVPSVASLFTGAYPSAHGRLLDEPGEPLPLTTLAALFRQAGARTAGISANRVINPGAGFGAGFEEFLGSPTVEGYLSPRARWVTDAAIACLRRFRGDRFFLYLHYMDPHDPYSPPPEWCRFGHSTEERYLGEIAYCDHEIDRLLAEVEALGIANETLVVFLADHGEAFGEHGLFTHGKSLHAEEVQVPLILRWPGRVPAGRRVPSQVRSIDVTATILDLANLPAPRSVEGRSLTPLLHGAGAPDRPAFTELQGFVDWQGMRIALDDGRYKLVVSLGGRRLLLFDRHADPDELRNLVKAQPDTAAALRRRVLQYVEERRAAVPTDAPALSPEQRRRLEALGYLDRGTEAGPAQEPPK